MSKEPSGGVPRCTKEGGRRGKQAVRQGKQDANVGSDGGVGRDGTVKKLPAKRNQVVL